ncbi:cytochrome protein [Corynespora cassiicola Philippines]|uniref:Cytochrome protein n=1 Tax=Corynespora cassiicola Philippines TaxID=1448308 RepID=A0A2T2N179_CORCC|nr:cytochrome protein [Corynespora cassiicola Philippines]
MEATNISNFFHCSPMLFGSAVISFIFLIWTVYGALRHPLAHLPGPKISKWTNLRLQYSVLKGDRVRYIHQLHEIYGPVVRISPSEVSIAELSAVKTIYKVGSPYVKSSWYAFFTGDQEQLNLLTHTDPHAHSVLRRLVAYNFSEKWIKNLEPFISNNVKLAISRIADDVQTNGYSDVFKWFTFMATDVIGEASFGKSFHMLDTGKKNQYIKDLENVAVRGMLRSEFPLLTKALAYIPWIDSNNIQRSAERGKEYSRELIDKYWAQLKADPDNVKPTLITKEFAAVEDGSLTPAQLQSDGAVYIVAGTDTTAATATNVVWRLAHHRDIEEALIREVSSLPKSFTDEDLRPLKLLNNVITETLRLLPPVGQSLPRVVPEGGAQLGGWHIPQGTIVGVQAWTMHRKSDIWTDPEEFDPSRWNNPSKDMLNSYYPFGGGSRVCIGSHFALLELRHAIANFYRTFQKRFRKEEMEPITYFLTLPSGKRCMIKDRK